MIINTLAVVVGINQGGSHKHFGSVKGGSKVLEFLKRGESKKFPTYKAYKLFKQNRDNRGKLITGFVSS